MHDLRYTSVSFGAVLASLRLPSSLWLWARLDVLWLVLRQVVVITTIGLAAGVSMAIAGGNAVASLLYGVKPIDPTSLVLATTIMMTVAGLAGYIPARRAAGLDPLVALRVE